MLFPPLSKNGPIKRQREAQLLELRALKRSSPTPSETQRSIQDETHSAPFGISTPLKDVLKKCGSIHRNRSRERVRRLGQLSTSAEVADSSKRPITPEASPLKEKYSYWESKRLDSTGQLAISSPLSRQNEKDHSLSEDFADLSLALVAGNAHPPKFQRAHGKTHEIFLVKEILEHIIGFVHADPETPDKKACSRRKPLSYNHALLIYKDERKANKVWKECNDVAPGLGTDSRNHQLYNCLTVSKLWYSITIKLLLKNIYFRNPDHFRGFVEKYSRSPKSVAKPTTFILHKFHKLLQADLNQIADILVPDEINLLEFYICPNITPPVSWMSRFRALESLILPGNKAIDDKFLFEISAHIPNLNTLDLRACDNITDSGIVAIALRCPQLVSCNLGRHRNGENITSVSVVALARHARIETLGVAGCEVTDAGIWELAQLRGKYIKRLSLNNCKLLTNNSIPSLFAFNFFPNLSVLEIRNVHQIDDLRHIVQFKYWKRSQRIPILIEGCERITKLLSIEEAKFKRVKSMMALKDMEYWINKNDE